MKLLLTSAGITNNSIAESLLNLSGMKNEDIKIAFVPTAANVEEGDKGWLIEDYQNLKKQGYKIVDIVDISALPIEMWKPRMEDANILFFGGGNTFHLMYWIEKSGLDKLLPKLLETRVYAGISAGSMVVSRSILLTSDKPIFNENRLGKENDIGLGFIDFYVRPHFNSLFFPKAKAEYIKESAKNVSEPIYAIDDQTAIEVNDDEIKIVSEGKYLVLNK